MVTYTKISPKMVNPTGIKFEKRKVTCAKISSKMVNPRDTAGNTEEEEEAITHTSDFKVDTLLAVLPGACCYRVSAGTGWSSVSIL